MSRTLELGAGKVARVYGDTSDSLRGTAHTLDIADRHNSNHLLEETRTAQHPHPMQMPEQRDWNYRPSDAESAMAARRMTTCVDFTGDMRTDVARSSTEVRKMLSEGGGINIYKPIAGENFDSGLPFSPYPGALTSREIAAYRVDEIFGFGRIPPTAHTEGVIGPNGRPSGPGMIQQFVDSEGSRPLKDYPRAQQQQVGVLDYVIGATDRHAGNYRTVNRGDHLDILAIDHGRSFPVAARPLDVGIYSEFVIVQKGEPLEPEVLDSVRNADTGRLHAALGDAGLHSNVIDGTLARLERVQELGQIPDNARVSPLWR